jgi:hypothetical protein
LQQSAAGSAQALPSTMTYIRTLRISIVIDTMMILYACHPQVTP